MFDEPMSWVLSMGAAASVAVGTLLVYLESLVRIRT